MARARVVGFGEGNTCGNCGEDLSSYGTVISLYSIGVTSSIDDTDGDLVAVRDNAGDAEAYRMVCKSCDEILWQDEDILAWRQS